MFTLDEIICMKVKVVDINLVKKNPHNPRIIKDEKFEKLVKSIREFPKMLNIRPIVVNSDMIVLGGNMRIKACREAGLKEVPIIIADELNDDEQKEFIIKDNIGFGEWDWEMLANEWDQADLSEWGLDVINTDDIDIDEYFGEKEEEELTKGKIVLEYTLEEAELVKKELLRHAHTPELAVYKLLGL